MSSSSSTHLPLSHTMSLISFIFFRWEALEWNHLVFFSPNFSQSSLDLSFQNISSSSSNLSRSLSKPMSSSSLPPHIASCLATISLFFETIAPCKVPLNLNLFHSESLFYTSLNFISNANLGVQPLLIPFLFDNIATFLKLSSAFFESVGSFPHSLLVAKTLEAPVEQDRFMVRAKQVQVANFDGNIIPQKVIRAEEYVQPFPQ